MVMGGMRRGLARVAAGWLVCHIGLIALTPSALCLTLKARTVEASCTCAHTEGPVCPMHHQSVTPDPQGCSCRGATDPQAVALTALIGPSAVLPPTVATASPTATSSTLTSALTDPIDITLVPEAPPPRA